MNDGKDWVLTVEECFDENGDFTIKSFDPYRDVDSHSDFYNALFFCSDYGVYLRFSVEKYIRDKLSASPSGFRYDSDMVRLIHYDDFAGSTKGNYDVRFGWR